jgi:hypothetical protein
MDQTIHEFAIAIFAIATPATFPVTRHLSVPFSIHFVFGLPRGRHFKCRSR